MENYNMPSDICIWLACCIVVCFGGPAESGGGVQEVELSSNTSHYTIVTNKLSWNDAQDACARTGSHLVCVNSAEESEYLKQAIVRSDLPSKYYWIGLVVDDDGSWAWQDGTGLGYENWWHWGGSSGNSESDEDSVCVTVHMPTQGWRTKGCNKKNYYICEKEIANATVTPGTPLDLIEDTALDNDSQTPQSTTVLNNDMAALSQNPSNSDSTEDVCPDGFSFFESSCYHLISETLTDGINSRNACANIYPGSHLAFIESQSEQTFLEELVVAKGVDFWFGLTFTTDKDHPEWMDGRPLGNFTAWDGYGVFDESSPCVRLRRRSNFFWNDRPCTGYSFGCICEMEIEETQSVLTPTPAVTAPQTSPQTKEAVYKAGPSDMAAPMGSQHLQSMSALSLFRCATYCLRHNNCASFNYKSAEGRAKLNSFCELYSMQFPDEELTVKRGYRYYRV